MTSTSKLLFGNDEGLGRQVPWFAGLAALLVVALELRFGAHEAFFWAVIVAASFVINGLPIVNRMLFAPSSQLGRVAIAFFVGLVLTTYLMALVLLLVGWEIKIMVGVLVGCNVLALLAAKNGSSFQQAVPWLDPIGAVVVFLVLVSVFAPLWNVGELTERGYAFASLFSHDFIFRIGYTAHVARGMSEDSIFMAGLAMPNQYLFYVFPAFIYKLSGLDAGLVAIFRILSLLFAVFFPCLFVELFRQLGLRNATVLMVSFIAFFAYSMSAPFVMLMRYIADLPLGWVAEKVGDLVSGQTLVSQGWIRDLLVEPHSVVVIALSLICFLPIRNMIERRHVAGSIFIVGALACICFGMDSFLSLLLMLWLLVILLALFFVAPAYRSELVAECLLIGIFGAVILSSFYFMGIFNPWHSAGTIYFAPYFLILVLLPVFIFIEYGAIVLLALASVIYGYKSRSWVWIASLVLLFVCLLFMLFFQHAEPNVVQRKAGKLMMLAFLMLYVASSGQLTSDRMGKYIRQLGVLILVFFFMLGVVNSMVNIFIFSKVDSDKYASFVKKQDYDAIRWVIKNTPAHAIVQSLPEYYPVAYGKTEGYRISLFSQLGERAMALGNEKFATYAQTSVDTVSRRSADINSMFAADSAAEAYGIAVRYKIDYIFLGSYESQLFPNASSKFGAGADCFERVYAEEGVSIFRVLPTKANQACLGAPL